MSVGNRLTSTPNYTENEEGDCIKRIEKIKCIPCPICTLYMEVKKVSDIEDWEKKWLEDEFLDGTELRAEPLMTREPPGWPTVGGRSARTPPNRTYWVKTDGGKVFEFGDGSAAENSNKARAMAVLWYRSGGFEIGRDESMVPVKVAALGKPAIATYLGVTQPIDRDEIAELLNISKGTVEQYVSKVRRGHR